MKLRYLICAGAMLALSSIASAQSGVSWSFDIIYSSGTHSTQGPFPTYIACNFARSSVVIGGTVIGTTNCSPTLIYVPRVFELDERLLDLIKWPRPWPWPPVCLSCPPIDFELEHEFLERELDALIVTAALDPKITESVYGEQVHAVEQLKEEFGMNTYLKEVSLLNKQYDVEGFVQALDELEQSFGK